MKSRTPMTVEVTTSFLHFLDYKWSATYVIVLAILHKILEAT